MRHLPTSWWPAWQPSHFDPHTCSHQTYPQALVALRSDPGQTSPEVRNRGISGPTKRTCVLQKFFKKKNYAIIFSWVFSWCQDGCDIACFKATPQKKRFTHGLVWIRNYCIYHLRPKLLKFLQSVSAKLMSSVQKIAQTYQPEVMEKLNHGYSHKGANNFCMRFHEIKGKFVLWIQRMLNICPV